MLDTVLKKAFLKHFLKYELICSLWRFILIEYFIIL